VYKPSGSEVQKSRPRVYKQSGSEDPEYINLQVQRFRRHRVYEQSGSKNPECINSQVLKIQSV
jgi:hypothetical protein